MRVLVTGASGFVGRALTRELAQSGVTVRAAARERAAIPNAENIEPATLPDLMHPVDWRPLLRDADAVVHLAGLAHAAGGVADDSYDKVNRLATKSLALAASLTPGLKRLIFVSSVRAQSGPSSDRVLTESDAPQPTDGYGRSKLAAETFVRGYGVPGTILRPVVIYGPGVKANIASLARIAASPLPLPFAALGNKRSLLALANMISAIRFTLEQPATAGETYLVADPTAVTLADMIGIMRRARGHRPGLFPLPAAWMAGVLKMAGRGHVWERIGGTLVADPSKLRAAGWAPPTDTPQALAALAQASRP